MLKQLLRAEVPLEWTLYVPEQAQPGSLGFLYALSQVVAELFLEMKPTYKVPKTS
jgi:hypothetical protein